MTQRHLKVRVRVRENLFSPPLFCLFYLKMSKRLFSQVVTEEENSKGAIPLSKQQPDLVNGIPLSGEDYLLVVR